MQNNDLATSSICPLLHRIPEACHRIAVRRSTLYRLFASGDIVPVKIGVATLIPESELQRFLAKISEGRHAA